MRASDITDERMIAAVESARDDRGEAKVADVQARFHEAPPKIVLAKLQSMIRRGQLEGCCDRFTRRGRHCVVYVAGEHATIDRAALSEALADALRGATVDRGAPN